MALGFRQRILYPLLLSRRTVNVKRGKKNLSVKRGAEGEGAVEQDIGELLSIFREPASLGDTIIINF